MAGTTHVQPCIAVQLFSFRSSRRKRAPSLPDASTPLLLAMHSSSESFMAEDKRLTKYGSIVKPLPADDTFFYADDCDFSFFEKGRDVGGSETNYIYTRKEQEVLAQYESVDYMPSYSLVFKSWVRQQSHRLDSVLRWLTMGFIGITVGVIGFFLRSLIGLLSDLRMDHPRAFLQADPPNYLLAWAWATGFSVLFLLVSAALVVYISPSAGSSGIPELTAFLNGTLVRHIFNVKTLFVKYFSCILAVASGMPLGQEGPMIHIGSIVGSWLSQFKSDTLKFKVPFFQRFRNSQDRRNFISAGAAAGIATAFNAPVGGLLFSMEEVSSFWNETLSWQTFFCCVVAVLTNMLMESALPNFKVGKLGNVSFKEYILFQVKHGFDFNLAIFVPVIILGVLGGLLGALFIFLNLKIHRMRKRVISGMRRHWMKRIVRLSEPVLVGVLYTTASIFLPVAFSCKPIKCTVPAEGNSSSNYCLVPTGTESVFLIDKNFDNYTCPRGVFRDVELTSSDNHTYSSVFTNASYSPAATLTFVTGEKAIRHLFSRETYAEFDYDVLVTVLVIYFVGACYSAGMSLSSGLVIPQLLIGALYGRLAGRVMVMALGRPTPGSNFYWIDSGAMSLIGAASFFGGVTRLTTSITVLMMELTNDTQFLLPVMGAVMVAKWVGDLFTHSIYHAQMNLKCIPHLNSELVIHDSNNQRVSLAVFTVEEVMTCPVETVKEVESLQRIVHLLLHNRHGGFPVIRCTEEGIDVLVGFITRLELTALVMKKAFLPQSAGNCQPEFYTQVDYEQLTIDRLSKPQLVEDTLRLYTREELYQDLKVWLGPYMNQSTVSLKTSFSLDYAQILMRSLGIRHITIVDNVNRVVGIVTRKDLMGFNVESRLKVRASDRILLPPNGLH